MAETEGLEIEKEVITEPEPIMDEGPTGRWLDLKEELWEKLITIEDEKEEYELIRTSSSIDSPEDNQRAMITLDFIFYNLHFCKDKEMTFGQAKIIMKLPIDGRRNFTGTIQGVEQEQVLIDVDGERYVLPYAKLAKARLVG